MENFDHMMGLSFKNLISTDHDDDKENGNLTSENSMIPYSLKEH